MELPRNSAPKHALIEDKVTRRLDCLVLNFACTTASNKRNPYALAERYQTVRGLFPEDKELYPDAGFKAWTHTQLCVRNQDSIIGTFRVREHAVSTKIWDIIKPR